MNDIELRGVEDTDSRGQISASDPDGAKLTYKLKNGPRFGEATLDAATGAFTYVPMKDFSGDDAFTVEASNGKRKATALVKLDFAEVNDAPTTAPLSLKTAEDTLVSGSVLASDVDRDSVAYLLSSQALHGEASVDARSGAVTYQPSRDYHGVDSFTVEVTDGRLTAKCEVSVVVASVNDGPVAAASKLKLDEDGRLEAKPIVSDVDGDTLTYRVAKLPKHGELEANVQTGAFTYVPAKNFHGDDAFTLEVTDGKRKATAAISLQVVAVNDAPVTQALALASSEDVVAIGSVIASDVDGNALSYKLGSAAAHGTVLVDAKTGRLTYSPAADYNGADAFTVEVSDGALTVSSAVSVAISSVNDAPRVATTSFDLDEDVRFEGKPTASDVDGDTLVYRVTRKPTHGVFELNAQTGAFSYHPARDYNGPDGFTLEVSDGKLRAETVIGLAVRAINDAPVAKSLALSTQEDAATKATVIASDVDDAVLSYRVRTPASHGQANVDPRTGAVTYIPVADYNGPDGFTIEVKDGALSVASEVTVAIAAVPDIPRVKAELLPTAEDATAEGQLPGFDVDGDRLTFHLLSQPRLGSAVLLDAATGAWRFVPGADLNGDDEIAFDVSDGTTTVKGSVKIRVAPVNDAPTLANLELSTLEDQTVEGQLIGKDIDGDPLTYSIAAVPARGRSTIIDAAKGAVRFEPARDHHGTASFTVTVSDGKAKSAPASVAVRVEPQNDAPVANVSKLTTNEDTTLVGAMRATDVDGEPVAFAVVRVPLHGTVSVTDAASGLFVYSPAANYFGPDDFDFSATDAAGASSVSSIRLTVTPVDDVPIAAASGISAPFRGTVTGRLYGYDRESKTVTYRIVDQPSNGRVKLLNPRTGDFEFSTDGTTSSAVEFRFEVSDGALTSVPAELVVQIRSL